VGVQVCAKGKGGRMRTPMAPSGEMVSDWLDLSGASAVWQVSLGKISTWPCSCFVVVLLLWDARSGSGGNPPKPFVFMSQIRPSIPEVDPDNEEFCVFTRAKTGVS